MRIAVGNDNSQLKQLWHFICMGNAMRLRAISAASERLKVSGFRAEFRQIGTSALGIQNAEERLIAVKEFLPLFDSFRKSNAVRSAQSVLRFGCYFVHIFPNRCECFAGFWMHFTCIQK